MVGVAADSMVVRDNYHGKITEDIPPMGEIGNDLGATDRSISYIDTKRRRK